MSELFQPAGDFAEVVDGLTSVTLRRSGSDLAQPIPAALRRPAHQREAQPSGGRYTQTDAVWLLALPDGAEPPQVGDAIVDGDDTWWTVLEVTSDVAGTRWRCAARRLRLVAGPNAWVAIERATWTKGESGALVATWHELRAGVPAHVQPIVREIEHEHDRQIVRATHEVTLGEPIELGESDRLVTPEGRVFRVVSVRNENRIDALPLVQVVELPEEHTP